MKKVLNLEEIKNYLGVNNDATSVKLSINPKQAKSLLKNCNKINRRISAQHVETLKRDMEAGNWYSDIDYIGFNSEGMLINGQHRLKALSTSNIEFVSLKFDFDVEQHISMDTGNARKYTDQIALSKKSGIDILPNKFKVIISAGLKLTNSKLNLSNTELYKIWGTYHEQLQLCEDKGLFNLSTRCSTVVKSSLFWAYLSGVSIDTLEHIAKVLRNGITESELDIPIIRLRDEFVYLKGNSKELDIKRAKYTQHCIFMVLQGLTTNRLPANPIMHYQDFQILGEI